MASDDVRAAFASQPRRNSRTATGWHGHASSPVAADGLGAAAHPQRFSPQRAAGSASAAMHGEHAEDPHSSGGESELDRNNEGGNGGGGGSDADVKRRRRLELNRKAAKESRRRKKMRIEELGRSVVFLTRENQELREQNEIFRQMVANEVAPDGGSAALSKLQAENAALRKALYEKTEKDHLASPHGLSPAQRDSDGAGSGKGSSLSLPDHHMSGPVPSLAAAAAAVGNPTGSSSPSHSMLSSLPSLPPPPGGGQSAVSSPSLHSSGSPSSSMVMQSSFQHLSPSGNKSNGGSGGGGGNSRPDGSMLDAAVAGAPGSSGVGGGTRLLAPGDIGAPFLSGGGLGVLASLTGGGRDGTSSSQPGGRALHPKSMSTFVSVGGGVWSGGPGRSPTPPHLQSSGYGDHQQIRGYGGNGAITSSGRKLDRGGAGGGGSGSGAGEPGVAGAAGPGGPNYSDMLARATANAARARSNQQQHSDSGDTTGGAAGGTGASGSSSRRGGGWTSSWPATSSGWESTGSGAPAGGVERDP